MIRRLTVSGKVKHLWCAAEAKASLKKAFKSRAVDAKPRELRTARMKWGNTPWRSELTSVEKLGDELCGGLKVSSNVEIARSLRNNFRVNVRLVACGGRATEFGRGPTRLPSETKLRIPHDQGRAARRRGISSVVERGTTQTAR